MASSAPITPARWGRLLSTEDAAEYLGISSTTLRTLGIKTKPIGRRVMFDRLDLDRWVDRMEDQPVAPGDFAKESASEEERFFSRRQSRGSY